MLTIGRVASRAGVNIETIRYYERRGLLAEPPRTPSGYRQYAGDAVDRLRFIKRAQDLGFSLEEIRGLLDLRLHKASSAACAAVETRTAEKIALVDGKIRQLEQMKRGLERLVAACHARAPTGDCPILETLEDDIHEEAGSHA